ncbi:hypothetical protein AYX19_20975 (plasmid) [Paenarthrobacter ureafaciens]|nr:hypothetical protein AYX19_20975 [Paenarthrobacter ureafaciens]
MQLGKVLDGRMLAGGLPGQLCNGDEQRPHGANSINQSLADQGGPARWFAFLGFGDQGFKTGTQLSIWHRTLRAQGNKFAEQRFVHCGPIDGSGDIGGSLTPQIGDPALHHKDQLVCGGEQAIPKKACDLHGARWLFDLGSGLRAAWRQVGARSGAR